MARYKNHVADGHQGHGRTRRLLTRYAGWLLACLSAVLLLAGADNARAKERRHFLAYHASWYETPAATAEATTLAGIPGFMDIVALAFARPDAVYAGDLDISRTGLQYPYPGPLLRDAIRLLKKRNTGTRVVISVGGKNWHRFDEHALARLVRDLGADGIDLDFEPEDPACTTLPAGKIVCGSYALWTDYIERIRAVLPRPFLLTIPVWSVGAYGEGAFAEDQPRSPWTGSMLGVLRSSAARHIDIVSIMGYDAGPRYDPERAFAAYRSVWSGPLLLGIASQPVDPSSPVPTAKDVARLMATARRDAKGGAMLYALRVCSPETGCQHGTDYRALARDMCLAMRLDGCDRQVP
ncbi:hypothetical protein ACFFJ7_16470 [Pseudochelatococcus lubricantis]|uniref:hypothetical protein n=1 Tax=Pseudochelatococcus lubricantis TaxID=1538102 RepID=UPI0035F0A0DF